MGRAEDLFLRIEQEGESAIDKLITDQTSEELFIDFKQSADNGSSKRLHDHDRVNLKKSVCGFANSEGGIIIWGVSCSPSSESGDTASKKLPIENPRRFVSWLEGTISGLTIPPVVGVRSIAIQSENNLGYAVTLVPRSTHAPHQLAGEGKYMIRAGSNFSPAPHGVVAGLFGKPPQPVVFPNFIMESPQIVSRTVHDKKEYILRASLSMVLVNDGNVVAEDLFASFFFPISNKGQVLFSSAKNGWRDTSGFGFDKSYLTEREVRLAPRGSIEVCEFRLEIGGSILSDFEMRVTAGCRGAVPSEKTYTVSKQKLSDIRNRAIAMYEAGNVSQNKDWFNISNELFGVEKP